MILIYILYLFSGIIKSVFIFYNINLPVDITLLTAIILILNIFIDFALNGIKTKKNKTVLLSLFFSALFFMWITISLLYTKSENYAYIKTLLFLTNIIAFAYPLLISKFSLLRFLKYFILSVIVLFVWFYSIYFLLAVKFKGSDLYYQMSGLFLTLGILGGISLLLMLTSREKIFKSFILNNAIILLLSGFLLVSGARGPIFFVILSYLFFLINKLLVIRIKTKANLKKIYKLFFIGIPGLAVLTVIVFYKFYDKIVFLAERSMYRISLILSNVSNSSDMGSSVDVRMEQYKFSVDSIFLNLKTFLLGYGFGSFGIMYTGTDGRLYPHNIFLEIWFELGIIGLSVFFAYLIIVFFRKIQSKIYITGFVILYIILNMLKSSSIVDIRVFFAFFGLSIIQDNLSYNSNKK